MIKNIKKALLLGIVLLSTQINAQLKKGQLVDGIAAVIGNEIVLESDITEQENHAKQMGEKISGDNCEVVESLLNNRLLVYHAKKDTLIPNRSKEIKEQVNNKYNQILSQFPSEKAMLDTYKFRNSTEMKSMIEKILCWNINEETEYPEILVRPSEEQIYYEHILEERDENVLVDKSTRNFEFLYRDGEFIKIITSNIKYEKLKLYFIKNIDFNYAKKVILYGNIKKY